MLNKKTTLTFLTILFVIIVSGCDSENSNYSPDKVINNALEEKESVGSYYAEAEMKLYENEELTLDGELKEWQFDDGRSRIESSNITKDEEEDFKTESIAVNDGELVTIYEKELNEVITIDDPELLSTETTSPKEQADIVLDMVKDTHDVELEGEEEMLDREVYHIVAKANESDALLGDQELWIDKENWFVLKTISHTGNTKVEAIYTLYEEDIDEDEDLFEIDIPEDATYTSMDDVSNKEEVSLEEAVEVFGNTFYYFEETDELKINQIEMTAYMDDNGELEIDYNLDDTPYMTLSINENEVETDEEDDELLFTGEEEVKIRGEQGLQMDMDYMQMLHWQEDGIGYTISIIDPDANVEEIIEKADDMEQLK